MRELELHFDQLAGTGRDMSRSRMKSAFAVDRTGVNTEMPGERDANDPERTPRCFGLGAKIKIIMHRAGAASDLLRCSASRRLTSGQHPGNDLSRVKQDGFVLVRRDLDEA